MVTYDENDFLFAISIDLRGIIMADQKQKLRELMDEVDKYEIATAMNLQSYADDLGLGATLKKIGCYTNHAEPGNKKTDIIDALIVGVANTANIFNRPGGGEKPELKKGPAGEKEGMLALQEIFNKIVGNNFRFSWVVIPMQEASQGPDRFQVEGMGGQGDG